MNHLIKHPRFNELNVTALVRSFEKIENLKVLGIDAVLGSHSELAKIEDLASEADVVIAMVGLHASTTSCGSDKIIAPGRRG